MFLKNILKSQSGMSLAESAITAGLVGVVALGAASLAGNLGDAARKADGLVARTEFTSSLNAYLSTTMGCDDLKESLGAGGKFTGSPESIALTKWKYSGLTNIKGGYDTNSQPRTKFKYFELEELDAYLKPESTPQKITALNGAAVEDLTKSTLALRISMLIAGRSYKHIYNVPVLVNDAGELRFCAGERNVAESCSAIKGIYNPVTKKCDLAEGCILRGTYSVLTCDEMPCDLRFGAAQRNQFTNNFNCPSDSSAVQTHSSTWLQKRECGKKCTKNVGNQMSWYNCMKCP